MTNIIDIPRQATLGIVNHSEANLMKITDQAQLKAIAAGNISTRVLVETEPDREPVVVLECSWHDDRIIKQNLHTLQLVGKLKDTKGHWFTTPVTSTDANEPDYHGHYNDDRTVTYYFLDSGIQKLVDAGVSNPALDVLVGKKRTARLAQRL
jgi:hypothetical protein